jgi:glyoxylase-like metal-dependent hydrolase (beta-lactamase superfamily II)
MKNIALCAAALLLQVEPLGALDSDAGDGPSQAPAVGAERDLLNAMNALGTPQALRAAQFLHVEQTGSTFAGEQSRLPSELVAEARRVYRWYFDSAGKRALRDAEQHFPGGIRFWTRAAASLQGAWSVDVAKWRDGTDLQTAPQASAIASLAQFERFLPHLMLAQAHEARAGLEALAGGFRYADAAGSLIQVTLDQRTNLPLRASQIVDGKPTTETAYSDYERRHGLMMPRRVQVFQSGTLREDLTLGATRIGKADEARFTPPAGYSAPPPAGEPSAREIAPGIFLFENMQGDYHSIAVDQGTHLVLLEAPLSPAYAEAQKELLARLRPGKPVSYVLVTHHHGDHNGGLKTWAEAGATIVAAKGAAVALQRQLKARGLATPANIEEVDGSRSFGNGASRIDTFAFSSSHAASHLVMHMPGPKILFQGDMFYLPARGPVPAAFPIVRDLLRQINTLKLDVDSIIGVHGRPGTMADLRLSMRKAGLDGR